jgi:hypothetical protein
MVTARAERQTQQSGTPVWSLRRKPAIPALVAGLLSLLMLLWLNSMGTVCPAVMGGAPCPMPEERSAVVGQWALLIGPLAFLAVALGGLKWTPTRYVGGVLLAVLVIATMAAFISIVNTGGLRLG